MRTTNVFYLLIGFFALASCTACKDDGETTTPDDNNSGSSIPDLVVDLTATENGATIETIQFTNPKQVSTTAAGNGSYNSSVDLFAVNVLGKLGASGPSFTFSGPTGGVKKGIYDVAMAKSVCSFSTSTPEVFLAGSGTVEITNATLYANAGVGSKEHFCDFKVDVILQSPDKSRSVAVKGTIKGVNIKEN